MDQVVSVVKDGVVSDFLSCIFVEEACGSKARYPCPFKQHFNGDIIFTYQLLYSTKGYVAECREPSASITKFSSTVTALGRGAQSQSRGVVLPPSPFTGHHGSPKGNMGTIKPPPSGGSVLRMSNRA